MIRAAAVGEIPTPSVRLLRIRALADLSRRPGKTHQSVRCCWRRQSPPCCHEFPKIKQATPWPEKRAHTFSQSEFFSCSTPLFAVFLVSHALLHRRECRWEFALMAKRHGRRVAATAMIKSPQTKTKTTTTTTRPTNNEKSMNEIRHIYSFDFAYSSKHTQTPLLAARSDLAAFVCVGTLATGTPFHRSERAVKLVAWRVSHRGAPLRRGMRQYEWSVFGAVELLNICTKGHTIF